MYFRECSTSVRTHTDELVGDKSKERRKRHPTVKITTEKSGKITKYLTKGGIWRQ